MTIFAMFAEVGMDVITCVIENSILGVVVWFLMTRQEKQTRNQNLILLEFMRSFYAHDAQVRGVNPSVGEDKERLETAAREYKAAQSRLVELRDMIKER